MFIEHTASEVDLWKLSQEPNESLRAYLARFKETTAKIANPNRDLALAALKNGLTYNSSFRRDLAVNGSPSLEDALHRGLRFAQAEEDDLVLAAKLGSQPPSSSGHRNNKRSHRSESDSQGQGQHNYAVTSSQQTRTNTYDPEKYCTRHQRYGHATEECRFLKTMLALKYARGELEGVEFSDDESDRKAAKRKPPAKPDNAPEGGRPKSPPPASKKRIDLVMAELDLNRVTAARSNSPPPAPLKTQSTGRRRLGLCCGQDAMSPLRRIDYIQGGSRLCRDSVNSIKAHQRKAEPEGRTKVPPQSTPNQEITFTEDETRTLSQPHDDALVVRLEVGGCEMSRIMIDTGSSVDLIFYDALKKLDVEDYEITGGPAPLTGFAGNTTLSMGTVKLTVIAEGERRVVEFIIVDRPAPFNAILGRPWLYSMKAVPSTYHLCVKFPTSSGIKTVWGSQRQARECYMASYQLATSSPQ